MKIFTEATQLILIILTVFYISATYSRAASQLVEQAKPVIQTFDCETDLECELRYGIE